MLLNKILIDTIEHYVKSNVNLSQLTFQVNKPQHKFSNDWQS
jgi:hypothetical protein